MGLPEARSKLLTGGTNIVFLVSFLLLFVTSMVYMGAYLDYLRKVGTGKALLTPSIKSLYTTTYGQSLDSQHVGLFGLTSILKSTSGDFMPVAALPLSFDQTGGRFDKNLTYFHCLDPFYLDDFPAADQERMKQICMVERPKQVAFYMNDARSLTFSSSWNPMFMTMIVLFLYTSWFLLLSQFPDFVAYLKPWVYAVWQGVVFVLIVVSGIIQVEGTVIPRNNVLFALVLLGFTMAQQVYTIKSSSFSQGEWSYDLLLNFHEQKRALDYKDDDQANPRPYGRFRLMNSLIGMNVLLLPTFVLCLYSLSVNNVSEWMLQSVFVRYVLIVVAVLLLNYRKINPIYFQIYPDNEDTTKTLRKYYSSGLDWIMSDYNLLFIGTAILLITTLFFDMYMFDGFWKNGITGAFSMTIYALIVILFVLILFSLMFMGNTKLDAGVVAGAVTVFVVLLSYMVFSVLVGTYNEYYCSTQRSSSFYCGNAVTTKNLNRDAYTFPLKITHGTFDGVFDEISGSLTFAL